MTKDAFLSTIFYCPGEGETALLQSLLKVNNYSINDDTLTLLTDATPVMRLVRKN